MGKLLIGTSGYSYPHWGRGVFYPEDVPQRRWLEFYSREFNTVELNVTLYTDEELTRWAQKAQAWLDQDRSVYAYFNNDVSGYAIENARRLREILTAA